MNVFRITTQTDQSIERMDAARRAREVGRVLVTGGHDMAEAPERVLLDVAGQNAEQMLAEFVAREAKFSTAPFDPAGERLRFYPGGVTIWSGYPGAGKTTILRQLCCHLLAQKHGVFFASLEEDPAHLLIRLAGVAVGSPQPTVSQMQWFLDWFGDRLRVWGVIGIARHKQLLGVVQDLAKQNITHVILDSLMCLDIDNGDFERQRQFANLLAATARSTGMHIHLVAHPRKVVNADQEPDINDVAGAREIGGIADNVLFVRRGRCQADDMADAVPMRIAIRKQRHGSGSITEVQGWLIRSMRQYQPDQFATAPTRYLPDAAYAQP